MARKHNQHERSRCGWATVDDAHYVDYHDKEWGVPIVDDRKLFEFIILESAQAGLSWRTVLHKREGYRRAFKNFDPTKVARMTESDVIRLQNDQSIIRNRLKIKSAIRNAQAFLVVQQEFGSFAKYIWSYVDNQPVQNNWKRNTAVPTTTALAERMAKDLKRRGFSFLGPTVWYAYMQAVGMVNDHIHSCFRHSELFKQKRVTVQ